MRSVPVTRTYLVPVRQSQEGTLALKTGRLMSDESVGLAFTSEAALLMTLGPSQQWIPLSLDALRAMLSPLGVTSVRVDPRPIAELGRQGRSSDWPANPVSAGRPVPHVAA
jgi:hypothetical protein